MCLFKTYSNCGAIFANTTGHNDGKYIGQGEHTTYNGRYGGNRPKLNIANADLFTVGYNNCVCVCVSVGEVIQYKL